MPFGTEAIGSAREWVADLRQDLLRQRRFLDAGEIEAEAPGRAGEALVVNAGLVEHGGVEVVGGDGVLGGAVA